MSHQRTSRPLWVAMVAGLVATVSPTARPAAAQNVSLGSVRTEAGKSALRLAVDYAEQIGDIFRVHAPSATQGGSFTIVDLSPDVSLETGGQDAFNGIVAKVKGNIIRGKLTRVGGVLTPCATCFFNVLTVSAGMEADGGFDHTAYLLEVGYVPWFQNMFDGRYPILASSNVGFFIQGGYKADTGGSPAEDPSGGASDESAEDPASTVLRLRGDYKLTPIGLAPLGDNQIELVATASGWRDLLNSEWYYRVEAGIRLTLTADHNFDFLYQKGSGAPNFNTGDQFSANLSISF